MATIYETLRSDIINAVKARDSATALTLRTADAAIQRAALDLGKAIDESIVMTALRKAVKNLADAREEFAKAGRTDLVEANTREIGVLEKYLPKGLDADQIEALVTAVIKETGAATKKEMGKVIGALKKRAEAPLIDFAAVSKLVQSKLP